MGNVMGEQKNEHHTSSGREPPIYQAAYKALLILFDFLQSLLNSSKIRQYDHQ